MSIPVITIIGKSGSGKTTLLEGLIPELSRRGYRIATVKHHSHAGFDVDVPGKDSWRHAQAGSVHVIIAAPDKIASYRQLKKELMLSEIVQEVHDADLILVEGYKQAGYPSLEVQRAEVSTELVGTAEQRFAIAADRPLEIGVPCFRLEDFVGICDLIESRFLHGNAAGSPVVPDSTSVDHA
jgi:molybdopterin-guanine dinucleotide biosynthesis adapter protein